MNTGDVAILVIILAGLSPVVFYAVKKFGKIDDTYTKSLPSLLDEQKHDLKEKENKILSKKRYTILLPLFIFIIASKYVDFLWALALGVLSYYIAQLVWKRIEKKIW